MPGSKTTPGRLGACDGALSRVAFRYCDSVSVSVSTQDPKSIAAQLLAYAYPCQRFTSHLTMRRA
jgi:hypothetical protein